MSQTRLLVLNHLHPDLVNIVFLYFQSTKRTWKQMARAGEYEACLQCPSVSDYEEWEEYRFDAEMGLRGACHAGHLEIAKMMLNKGARNVDNALYYACRGGYIDMIELIIAKGSSAWQMGLAGACEGGHRPIADWMLTKGAQVEGHHGLYGAARSQKMDMVHYLLDKGLTSFQRGLLLACSNGHFEMAKWMIEKGANDFTEPMSRASTRNHVEVVQLLISHGAKLD